jgi:hypothetical protein
MDGVNYRSGLMFRFFAIFPPIATTVVILTISCIGALFVEVSEHLGIVA